MGYNNWKARQEICSHVIAKYSKIEVKPGKGLFNYQCHRNAVNFAKKHKHKKIAVCIYIGDGYPIVHFINYRKKKFVDNTLGQWTTQYDYYFVKWIEDKDMFNVFDYFDALKLELGKELSWWTRITSDYRG